ncbi:hypothetical protein Tco_1391959 [Tanacetum coccineum]
MKLETPPPHTKHRDHKKIIHGDYGKISKIGIECKLPRDWKKRCMLTRGVDLLSLKFEIRLSSRKRQGLVTVAYLLGLPQELSKVYNLFHVCNLKKCLSDDTLVIPLEEIQLDDKLHFVEEPIEIMDREVKQLKRSRIPIVKVRWNARRGPEYTWEREDQFKNKYPYLFTKPYIYVHLDFGGTKSSNLGSL